MNEKIIFDLKHVGCCYMGRPLVPWGAKSRPFWAVNDVTFQVHAGETVGVIGKNGAGKSTLLRLLAGIVSPDRGTFHRETQLRTTLLALGAGFDQMLSGSQNIYLNGMYLGMTRREIRECHDSIVELAELGEFIDQPVRTYSSGMRSRLGFAIAHQVNSDVILIDETLSVGDGAFRQKSSELIKGKLMSDQTVVLVTHSLSIIRDLCDRVVWIEHGNSMALHEKDATIAAYENYLKTGILEESFKVPGQD